MPPLNHFATFCVKNIMGKAHIQRKVTALPEHLTQFMLILLQNCAGTDSFPSQFNVAFEGLWHFQETTGQWLSGWKGCRLRGTVFTGSGKSQPWSLLTASAQLCTMGFINKACGYTRK